MGGRASKGYKIVVGEAGRAETPLPSGDDNNCVTGSQKILWV